MKSAKCRFRCSPSCCVCWKTCGSNAWGQRRESRLMSRWLLPPTRISLEKSSRGFSWRPLLPAKHPSDPHSSSEGTQRGHSWTDWLFSWTVCQAVPHQDRRVSRFFKNPFVHTFVQTLAIPINPLSLISIHTFLFPLWFSIKLTPISFEQLPLILHRVRHTSK